MSDQAGVTVAAIFESMPLRFRPEAAEGIDASFGYDLQGEGKWKLTVGNLAMRIEKTEDLGGCVVVTVTDPDTFIGVSLGRIDPVQAFGSGKFRVVGDLAALGKTARLFRKFTVAGEGGEEEQELLVLKKIISINQRYATGPVLGRMLAGLREKKIIGNRCPRCGRIQLPAREACALCRVRAGEFVEVGPRGYVTINDISYYASPDPLTGETRETPYGSINVLLDGCTGNETFWHFIRPDQTFLLEEAWNDKRGTRVRPVWAEHRTGELSDILYFEIDDEGGRNERRDE